MTAAVVAVSGLLVGCTGSSDPEPAERAAASPSVDAERFDEVLQKLCKATLRKSNQRARADTRKEYRERQAALIDAERRLVERASELQPPPSVEEPFRDYLDEMTELTDLAERAAKIKDRRAALAFDLQAARRSIKVLAAKELAALPGDCPPGGRFTVYPDLFAARANVACFRLAPQAKSIEKRSKTASAYEDVAALFLSVDTLLRRRFQMMQRHVPAQIENDGEVRELFSRLRTQMSAWRQMHRAFLARDIGAYDAARPRATQSTRRAHLYALRMGLYECVALGTGAGKEKELDTTTV